MEKSIYYDGNNYDEFKKKFLEYFSEEIIHEVFEVLSQKEEDFFDDDECFEINSEKANASLQGYNKLVPMTHYHVNLKNLSITCLQIYGEMLIQAAIKGVRISSQEIPIIPSINDLRRCFKKISEINGEFCICKEIECNKIGGWDEFTNSRRECVNNDMKCSHNIEGICGLTRSEFDNLVETLIQKGILEKNNEKYRIV